MNKNVPNYISLSRILLTLVLITCLKNKLLFLPLYIITAFTDVLDGYLARKYKIATELGAKLDSLADIFFYIVIIIYLGINYPDIVFDNMMYIISIFVIRIVVVAVGYWKHHRLILLHTLMDKSLGFLVFLTPLCFALGLEHWVYFLLFLANLASIEELAIVLYYKQVDVNRKSVFYE